MALGALSRPEPVEISSPLDGCNQFWGFIRRGAAEGWQNERAKRELARLAEGLESVDPIQARNLERMLAAESRAESSELAEPVFLRCRDEHDWPVPSQAEFAELQSDAEKWGYEREP